ncbi:hypothetical protein BKG68_23280 [Mycobacteroides saopaulense]|uniref:ESX-1 secretion-associated protein EspA/EspE-like domain-containing protein n=2 Tax=Mycobacteroides saopaulense TaxID=1578165 RepID=A0ABX3BWG3_9MYCO|nr:hypothetical protein BKG68_23280 [Mycobacteroides saopaulense]OHU07317.1 hypothetical protein BKG73_18885 [Mycobacteroides saopaulense]
MIKPVTDALGTLGTGKFDEGYDPPKMYDGISKTFETTGQSVQQAISMLGGIWQGLAGIATMAKSLEAVLNGVEVAMQASGIGGSLSTSATDVTQAEARLMEILHEWEAKMAALTPGLPWTAPGIAEACTQAVEMAVQCMTELQSSLGAESGIVSAIGAPLSLTSIPQAGSQAVSPVVQMASSTASQLSSFLGNSMSGGPGRSIGNSQGTAARPVMKGAALGGSSGRVSGLTPGVHPSNTVNNGGSLLRGALATPPGSNSGVPRGAATPPPASAAPAKAPTGGGMMGRAENARTTKGGSAGAGSKAGAGSDDHETASFLQTALQGAEVVGDQGAVSPAVLGDEAVHDEPGPAPSK